MSARESNLSLVDFAPGGVVMDVGCGRGEQLALLTAAGLHAVGVEPDAALARQCRQQGFLVIRGIAEALPARSGTLDGILCKVVVPYTCEARAIAEFARVLRPGGRAIVIYHGLGYYLERLLNGPGLPMRFYAARTLINSGIYATTGRRLPGWFGDTLLQSRRRLDLYYRRNGLTVVDEQLAPSHARSAVYIYHVLERRA